MTDWQRFCDMMEKAGWRNAGLVQDSKGNTTGRVWIHSNGLTLHMALGDWRQWLEDRQTPPPF